ncbi:unnamed protein product [Protopolystoma xenopodis]|uniref:LTD domain-containing protein n=1 Tax=Protopolystoma xenopodis TaxID=117903 RepID=A0A448WCI7_9PLAT|nr:unnamed protein product [Protopolystoma xenopodis]
MKDQARYRYAYNKLIHFKPAASIRRDSAFLLAFLLLAHFTPQYIIVSLYFSRLIMSARSRKTKPVATEPSTVSSTKKTTERTPVSDKNRSPSPLNISRSEEKDELAHLNDRLAGYIDYVRQLERDKERLTTRIKSVTEERLGKIDDMKKTYEDEIRSLRDLVDSLGKDKGAAEIELKKSRDDMLDAKNRLSKREQEIRNLQRKLDIAEKDLSNYKQDHDRYQIMKSEFDDLEKKCFSVKKELDGETNLRNNLENKILGLVEELDFKNRLLEEERQKIVHRTISVEEEVEERREAEFQSRLADELRAIREQTTDELASYKFELEETFQQKVDQLRSASQHASTDITRIQSELSLARRRADDLAQELLRKEAEVGILGRRVSDLDRQLESERDDNDRMQRSLREEISRIKQQLEESFKDFTDLMNTKIALDQEILMYRKMLEGEETRLNIKSPSRPSPFNIRPMKRRRMDGEDFDDDTSQLPLSGLSSVSGSLSRGRVAYHVTCNSIGPIEFANEQDGLGRWVRILNSSKEEASIGNWTLKQLSDGQEVAHKFHRSLIIKPDAKCSVSVVSVIFIMKSLSIGSIIV